jgi:hypothetical protein
MLMGPSIIFGKLLGERLAVESMETGQFSRGHLS